MGDRHRRVNIIVRFSALAAGVVAALAIWLCNIWGGRAEKTKTGSISARPGRGFGRAAKLSSLPCFQAMFMNLPSGNRNKVASRWIFINAINKLTHIFSAGTLAENFE